MPEHAARVPGTPTATTPTAAADHSRRRRRQVGSCGAVLELLISHVLLGAKDTRTDCLNDECRNVKPGGG